MPTTSTPPQSGVGQDEVAGIGAVQGVDEGVGDRGGGFQRSTPRAFEVGVEGEGDQACGDLGDEAGTVVGLDLLLASADPVEGVGQVFEPGGQPGESGVELVDLPQDGGPALGGAEELFAAYG